MNRDRLNVECLPVHEVTHDRDVLLHAVLVREWKQEVLLSPHPDERHRQVIEPRGVGGLVDLQYDRLSPRR